MRKLCWFALPFCAAVFAVQYALPAAALLPLCGALAGLAALAGIARRFPALLACAGLAAGLLWCVGYGALFRAPAQRLDGRMLSFQATVADWPEETVFSGARVTAWLEADGERAVKTLLYTGEEGLTLSPGDRVAGTAQLVPADQVRGETVRYYEARGVFLRAYARGALTVEAAPHVPVWAWPAYLSHALKASARALYPADAAEFLTALLTGDESGLGDGDYAALQRAGLAHVAAVSGMHLSFLAGLLGVLLSKRRRRLRAAVILAVLFFFAAVVGGTPSVVRSALMQAMTLLAPLLGREEDKPTTLSAILFVLLVWNPYSAASVSLQLSFGAVAGIYLVTQPLYRRLTARLSKGGPWYRRLGRRVIRFCAASLSATLGALLFTVPLAAVHFGTISLIAPLTNLLCLWAVSWAFVLGLPAVLVGIVLPGAAGVLALPALWLSRFVLAVARGLGALAFAAVSTESFYLRAGLAAVYAVILLALLLRRFRPVLPVCAGVCILMAALLLNRLSILNGPLTVVVFNVGQGQSILLASGGRTALIDCGGNRGNAGDLAADYLQTLGVSRLDLLILTHFHADHANGVPELFARMEVSALAVPDVEDETGYREEILDLARQAGTEVTFVTESLAVTLGESVLTLYAPLGDGGENEEGLFVLTTCGSFDLLVTGDANRYVEQRLVKYGNLPDVEVLIAGHHGAKYSSSPELLEAIRPEAAILSVGYNSYGHPALETLVRLAEREIKLYRTDFMGNITIRVKGD